MLEEEKRELVKSALIEVITEFSKHKTDWLSFRWIFFRIFEKVVEKLKSGELRAILYEILSNIEDEDGLEELEDMVEIYPAIHCSWVDK